MLDIVALIYEDHDWFRRHFFYLDHAQHEAELRAIWEPLAARLNVHAEAEETVFYPALLRIGADGDPQDETEDAIGDHNKIRDAVAEAGRHMIGSTPWWAAVGTARKENGEHLDEEEREGLPDFIKSSTPEQRHQLAMDWLRFYYRHFPGRTLADSDIEPRDKDPQRYIESASS